MRKKSNKSYNQATELRTMSVDEAAEVEAKYLASEEYKKLQIRQSELKEAIEQKPARTRDAHEKTLSRVVRLDVRPTLLV